MTDLFIRHALWGAGRGPLVPDGGVVAHPGPADGVEGSAGAELGQVHTAVKQLDDVCIFKQSGRTSLGGWHLFRYGGFQQYDTRERSFCKG